MPPDGMPARSTSRSGWVLESCILGITSRGAERCPLNIYVKPSKRWTWDIRATPLKLVRGAAHGDPQKARSRIRVWLRALSQQVG